MSAMKRKISKYLELNTGEMKRASLTNLNRKPSRKKRAVIDDYNKRSTTMDYISAIEVKQKNFKFYDHNLSDENYTDFMDALVNTETNNMKKYLFKKDNENKNACYMLRDCSEVAFNYLCEIQYDIGCKEKLEECNLSYFTQKLMRKY